MLKTETKEIGSHQISVTQFPGTKNIEILLDVGRFILPAASGFEYDPGKPPLEQPINIPEAVKALTGGMTKKEIMDLIKRLLEGTAVNDRPLDKAHFDVLFAGSGIWMLPKILSFVLTVNYGNLSEPAG